MLPELSGLSASARNVGLFWAHNDSGHATVLYLIRPTGEVVSQRPLSAQAQDAEAVAVGPCPEDRTRSCVVLGDLGDNLRTRATAALLFAPEPLADEQGTLEVQRIEFTYPDHPHDAEALLLDPASAHAIVITKEDTTLGTIFEVDLSSTQSSPRQAIALGTVQAPRGGDHLTTDASLGPLGGRILLRTYGHVWELRGELGEALDSLLSRIPTEVPDAPQIQGEAVAYTPDGRGYLLGGEGLTSSLFRIDCAQ